MSERPPVSNFHSRSIGGVLLVWLALSFGFAVWTWQAQTSELADAVQELKIP